MARKEATAARLNQATRTPETTKVSSSGQTSKMHIPDLELLDQNGRKIHFYTDLIKGQTVAINFIFTTCTTICPPLGATFARVQKELGDKAGRDVRFISISVDPATDTPERLKAWGAKFHAGDGWTFVTGDKPDVDELLRALGASSARREDHSPTVLIGNDAIGAWTRTYGLTKSSQLVQIISDMMAGKLQLLQRRHQTNETPNYYHTHVVGICFNRSSQLLCANASRCSEGATTAARSFANGENFGRVVAGAEVLH